MTADQFSQFYQLIFCAALVVCFGLGVIGGGQR